MRSVSALTPSVGASAMPTQTLAWMSCRPIVTGADSVELIAVYIGMLGLDFHVTAPPELVEQVRVVGERYRNAVP